MSAASVAVAGIGNAIVDVLGHADDETLERFVCKVMGLRHCVNLFSKRCQSTRICFQPIK